MAQSVSAAVKVAFRTSPIKRKYKVTIDWETEFTEDISLDVVLFEIEKELEYASVKSLPIGNISANALTLKLNNVHQRYNPKNINSDVYEYLKPNKKIRPYIGIELSGETVYFPQGIFYLRELKPGPNMTVDIYAVDRMFFLKEQDFISSTLYVNYKNSELVKLLVEDFGLIAEEYDIDETEDILPYAWFEPRRYAENIKKLAIAEGGVAFFDEEGIFKYKKRDWELEETGILYSDNHIVKDTAYSPLVARNMKNYISIKSNPLICETLPGGIYIGGSGVQAIYKYRKSDLAKISESGAYGGDINTLVGNADYIYAGGCLTQTVCKYQKTDLMKVAESSSYGGSINTLAVDDNYVYAGGDNTRKIYKYRKSDLVIEDISESYGGDIQALVLDNDYIYAVGFTTQKVFKYRKSDLVKVAESADYGGWLYALAGDNEFVYAGGYVTQKVFKYRKSDLAKVGESGAYGGDILEIVQADDYVYAGGATTRKVFKYQKADLVKVAESAAYGGHVWGIAIDTNYVYMVGALENFQPCKIWKCQKSDLVKITESSGYECNVYALIEDDILEKRQKIYLSTETITIGAGQLKTIPCYYLKVPSKDILDAVITAGENIWVVSEEKYAYATFLTVENIGESSEDITEITIWGKPLERLGTNVVISKNEDLILLHGKSEFSVDSEFIQNMTHAQKLADGLRVSSEDPEAELEFDSLSLPFLQLGDLIAVRNKKLNIGKEIE